MTSVSDPHDVGTADWRESWAYLIGMQAYSYGFPAIYYTKLRWGIVGQPQGVMDMPLNTLFHMPRLSDHTEQYGGSLMRDAIYSTGWLDLDPEPVVAYLPASGDRYVSVQLAEFYSDLFGYAGPSVNDGHAQTALIVGPSWDGEAPDGVDAVFRCSTPSALIVVRVSTSGEGDLAAAQALQSQARVVPLSNWLDGSAPSEIRDVLRPAAPDDELGDFATMNAAMIENPPPDRDAALLRQFGRVGLGPMASAPLAELDAATRRGLARALVDGPRLLGVVARAGGDTLVLDTGWFYGDRNWGRMADADDFLGRAAPQAFSGIVEHWKEQSTKLRTFVDGAGESLTGAHQYRLHFSAEQIPEAEAFWSVTLYNDEFNMVENPIGRYGLGSLSDSLTYGDDGSIEILLQHDAPPEELKSNWIPTPAGAFNLFLRTYLPGPSVVAQEYVPPAVERL